MYDPQELASFAVAEFKRGLVGITNEESRKHFAKADGSEMNSVSWTVGHVAAHWAMVVAQVTGRDLPRLEMSRYFGSTANPAPPSMEAALEQFAAATSGIETWVSVRDEVMIRSLGGDDVSQALMRLILHTWFHIGEINAMRQLLGHPEIQFLGPSTPPAWKASNQGAGSRQ